jgi:hypothetical protein
MELTDQEKKDILDSVLRKISHIGDKDYQRRVWINGEGPECDDFIETVCVFFHVVEIVLERPKEFGLHDDCLHTLEKFFELFEKFSDENDLPQLFIDTLEWTKITIMANEVLAAFGYKNRNSSEHT